MDILQPFASAAAAATATPRCPSLPTTAELEASIAALRGRKQRLREAYEGLLLSSPIPLPFRWSDLDAHISSLQSSIDARFTQLRALEASRAAAAVSPTRDAARLVEGSSCDEDVEMEDVQQQVVEEEMAAPSSTVQVKEEEEAALIAAAMAAKMAPPPSSMVKVKEEPMEVSLNPLSVGAASGLAAAEACATTGALADPAGVGQVGFAPHGVTQPHPVPAGCRPVLQQQHMASPSHHPALRQEPHAAASAVNAGDPVFRPQQHMGKPRDDACHVPTAPNANLTRPLPPPPAQRIVGLANANVTCPLPPRSVVVGTSIPPPPQRVGVFVPSGTNTSPTQMVGSSPSPPPKIVDYSPPTIVASSPPPPPPPPKMVGFSLLPQSQAGVDVSANEANTLPPSPPQQKQQLTAADCQLQKQHQQPLVGVITDPMNAGERPFQEQRQDQPTVVAGDQLLPQQQKQPFTANAPNAGQHSLQERHQQQFVTAAKPTNAVRNLPPRRLNTAASFAINPVLRQKRMQQWKMAQRPPNASNLSQPKQELLQQQKMAPRPPNAINLPKQEQQQSKADDGANPQHLAFGMAANPANSGDLPMEEESQQQFMANKHSVPVESAMPMKKIQDSGMAGSQPATAVAGDAAPKPAGDQQQQGQRKGGANRRGGRGHGNKNNYIANTNISNMSKSKC
uniref:Uncharacterized protein n=1 Tax=Leersia perrieri TaxID=77586 RepID=A0A0D9VW02_9ORYZ